MTKDSLEDIAIATGLKINDIKYIISLINKGSLKQFRSIANSIDNDKGLTTDFKLYYKNIVLAKLITMHKNGKIKINENN